MEFQKGEIVIYQPTITDTIYNIFCSVCTVVRVDGDNIVAEKYGNKLPLERIKKFPFEVGDEVLYTKKGWIVTIREISPNGVIRTNEIVDDYFNFRPTRKGKIKDILKEI
jgi:hypothetical protein